MVAKTKHFVSTYLSWFIVVAEILIFLAFSNTFFSFRNIMTVLRQVSITSVLASGVCFVMLAGNLDFSVGSIVSLSGVIVAKLYAEAGMPMYICALLGILTGGVIGFFNGMIVTKTKIPSIIGTIGVQQVIAGVALLITNGNPIHNLGEGWRWIAQSNLFGMQNGIPTPLLFVAVMLAITIFVLTKTVYGRRIYACGSNVEAARLSGIKTNFIHVTTYIISGLSAGLAGIMLMSRVNSGQPTGGAGMEMDVLTALVVGGISFSGGQGKIINVISGSLVIGILTNGLVNVGVTEFWQKVIKGLVLLFAVSMDAIQRSRKRAS